MAPLRILASANALGSPGGNQRSIESWMSALTGHDITLVYRRFDLVLSQSTGGHALLEDRSRPRHPRRRPPAGADTRVQHESESARPVAACRGTLARLRGTCGLGVVFMSFVTTWSVGVESRSDPERIVNNQVALEAAPFVDTPDGNLARCDLLDHWEDVNHDAANPGRTEEVRAALDAFVAYAHGADGFCVSTDP